MAVGYEPTTSWSRGVCSTAVLKPLLPPCSYFVSELTAPVSENLESCGSCGQFKNNHDQCPELTNLFLCFRVKRKPPRPPPLWPASSRRPSSRASSRRQINQLIRDEGIRTSKPIRTTYSNQRICANVKIKCAKYFTFPFTKFLHFFEKIYTWA